MSALRVMPALLLASVAACRSTTAPPPPAVSLLVQNGTCTPAGCGVVYVVGIPATQPHTPGGIWVFDFGTVTGRSACLSIPASRTFRIIEQPGGQETDIVWTTADTLYLGLTPAPMSRLTAEPTTAGFRPAAATGWSIVYPTDSTATPAAACHGA